MVSSVDTAAAPGGTAAAQDSAPPQGGEGSAPAPVAAPETGVLSAPETVPEHAPETGTQPEAGAPSSAPDPTAQLNELLSGLSDEDFAKIERIRKHTEDVSARTAESARRKAENESAQRLRSQEAQWMQKGEFVRDFERALAKSVRPNDMGDGYELDPDVNTLAEITDRMWDVQITGAVGAQQQIMRGRWPEGFVPTPEQATRLNEAVNAFNRDPRGAAQAVLDAELDVLSEAVVAARRRDILAEGRKDWEREQAAARKTAELQEAEAARRGQQQPTRAAGGGPAGTLFTTQSQYEAAIAHGQRGTPEYRQLLQTVRELRANGSWDNLPYT